MAHRKRHDTRRPAGVTALARLALLGALVAGAAHAQGAAALAPNAVAAPGASAMDRREIRAQLAPRRYTTLAAEIGAKVNRLPVPEGAVFRQGQALIQFDCTRQQTQLDKARATLGAAEKILRVNKRLAELNSVGKLELEIAEAEVVKARADVAANAAVIGKCTIAAPFAGRVAEQKVREQQYAQLGQALLEIIDDSTLELEFIVPSKWLVWLKPNAVFRVGIDETGKTYPAKVQRIGARVDPVTQSIKLNAVIDGRFPELIAGMSGRVELTPPAGR